MTMPVSITEERHEHYGHVHLLSVYMYMFKDLLIQKCGGEGGREREKLITDALLPKYVQQAGLGRSQKFWHGCQEGKH